MKEFNEIVQERTRESQRDCGFGSEIAPGSFLAVCPSIGTVDGLKWGSLKTF